MSLPGLWSDDAFDTYGELGLFLKNSRPLFVAAEAGVFVSHSLPPFFFFGRRTRGVLTVSQNATQASRAVIRSSIFISYKTSKKTSINSSMCATRFSRSFSFFIRPAFRIYPPASKVGARNSWVAGSIAQTIRSGRRSRRVRHPTRGGARRFCCGAYSSSQ